MGHMKWQQAELACCEASVSSCPVCPFLPLHTGAYLCSSPSHQSLSLPFVQWAQHPVCPLPAAGLLVPCQLASQLPPHANLQEADLHSILTPFAWWLLLEPARDS